MNQLPSHRLLLVHAHPDDETINNGATMAGYRSQGAAVTLVTCTRGEEGEVLVPSLAHLAAAQEDSLGKYREGELAAAMNELGVTDFQFLGAPEREYRDSGMMGTPPNQRPNSFWQADLDEASARLVAIIRDRKPQVLISYDEQGDTDIQITSKRTRLPCAPPNLLQTLNLVRVNLGRFPRSIGAPFRVLPCMEVCGAAISLYRFLYDFLIMYLRNGWPFHLLKLTQWLRRSTTGKNFFHKS